MARILSAERRKLMLQCLVEGMSVRATGRICGSDKKTVLKLLIDAGHVCAEYQDRMLRDLPCRRVEIDEIWTFLYAKAKNLPRARNAPTEAGDLYTWTAICRDTRLIISWFLGSRDADSAQRFIHDLKGRLANRVQLTSDGFQPYIDAVLEEFGQDVDYAMLQKVYGAPTGKQVRGRYTGSHAIHIIGKPDPDSISTSFVERNNLTMRMSMKRYARRSNGFSKKIENHYWMVALHFFYYNFCRTHESLRVTPAMEAGVESSFLGIDDIVRMIEEEYERTRPKTRGPYRRSSP